MDELSRILFCSDSRYTLYTQKTRTSLGRCRWFFCGSGDINDTFFWPVWREIKLLYRLIWHHRECGGRLSVICMTPSPLCHSSHQRAAQAGRQSSRPDAVGSRRHTELGSDVLHPAGASESCLSYLCHPPVFLTATSWRCTFTQFPTNTKAVVSPVITFVSYVESIKQQ